MKGDKMSRYYYDSFEESPFTSRAQAAIAQVRHPELSPEASQFTATKKSFFRRLFGGGELVEEFPPEWKILCIEVVGRKVVITFHLPKKGELLGLQVGSETQIEVFPMTAQQASYLLGSEVKNMLHWGTKEDVVELQAAPTGLFCWNVFAQFDDLGHI